MILSILKEDLYIESFEFLKNFRLTAIVNKKNGHQILRISLIDKNNNEIDFKELKCIHVALTNTTLEEIKKINDINEFTKKVLLMHSSENLIEINLTPEEKFKAFKSWVAGIAEAGYNAFYIQREIENMANFAYPISKFLIEFIAKSDRKILEDYLIYLERICRFEAQYHESSLIANLLMLKDIEGIIPLCASIGLPFNVLLKVFGTDFIADPIAAQYEEFKSLFNNDNWEIRRILNQNPESNHFEEKVNLFPENFVKNRDKKEIAKDVIATEFKEYKKFFYDEPLLKRIAASNPAATKFEEYRNLFNEKNCIIRSTVASNPSATKFEEYKKLFYDENWIVRSSVASNPAATNFKEYKKLFDDESINVKKSLAKNPYATKFEEFRKLFDINDDDIKSNLASNPNATKFEEYRKLFNEKKWSILINIMLNQNAKKFKEYEMFSNREFVEITSIEEFAQHPFATEYEEYKILFSYGDSIIRQIVAQNTNAVKFNEYKILFRDECVEVRKAVAGNLNATKFNEYKMLFFDDSIEVRKATAANTTATKFNEYRVLFNDESKEVRKEVALNPGSINFNEYKMLLLDESSEVREAAIINFKNLKKNEKVKNL